ncbi:MAG: DUF4350 domain-containing protein [Cyanobacteria bacterium CRU_2_1]|nr:DUF4350 domain-containing protein [Cyanobacteria bacterium CRU_2_1]
MTLKNRRIWIGAIAIIALILISLFAAPRSNTLRDGSTYSRAPNGYGAWYTYMQEQGASIQRWQKPLNSLFQPSENSIEEEAVPIDYRPGQKVEKSALLNDGMKRFAPPMVGVGSVPILKDFGHLRGDAPPKNNPKFSNAKKSSSFILHLSSFPQSPITVLQIDNGLGWLDLPTPEWIEQGNVFVRLGIQSRDSLGRRVLVTEAPFTSVLSSPEGGVKIETSRRLTVPPDLEGEFSDLLKDVHGTVVWQETLGQGRLIFAVTSYLAANAYQDEPGNFQFLEQLVNESGYPIWVDEYIHGYKDQEIIAEEASGSLVNYLVKTPIAVIAVQVGIMLLVLIWGLNRRLGPAVRSRMPR